MRIVAGFQSAKSLLSRQIPAEEYPVSENMRQGLKGMFATDNPEQAVRKIIGEVRAGGDTALFDLIMKIDGIKLSSLEVGKEQVASAYKAMDEELISALKLAAKRIHYFHNTQKNAIWHEVDEAGLRQLVRPLRRVGIYVPGGTAPYPSTVLMTAIPAKVAGVGEVILVTPPGADGAVSPSVLVAADVAQVDRIFSVGGAQAIAALAYGTESIPGVDKICGPGNIFVMLAKKAVFGTVAIDGLQGPSEVLVIADETASVEHCATDLLAQAEHDSLASAIMLTTSRRLADNVQQELACQLKELSRRAIAAESLEKGIIAVVASMDEAIELANLYAPEHLCLMTDEADSYIDKIYNAGCIVIGREATIVLGDYVAGPSHVLPTGGTARFSSPLSINDFLKYINIVSVDVASLKKLGPAASVIARAEGFDAHARAVEKRLKED